MKKRRALIKPESKKQTSHIHNAILPVSLALLCGCEGIQSALAPKGPQAKVIADISWIMFAGATFILLLVMALALYAIFRKAGTDHTTSSNVLIIGGGVIFPVVTLTALVFYTFYAMDTLRAEPAASEIRIEVIGNRWWWDVHYRAPDGSVVSSANEIHIPAGQNVELLLRTKDVIHSFWVPNLAGKLDLIPGRTNRIIVHADTPGLFRGQCAEFCGAQHAHMAFLVRALPPEEYAAWLVKLRAIPPKPTDGTLLQGREAFVNYDCIRCHTVRGVSPAYERGPDLTHIGSRQYIAAGMLPNTRGNLMSFIAQSQLLKPANRMPSYSNMPQEDLRAIAAYLESLK